MVGKWTLERVNCWLFNVVGIFLLLSLVTSVFVLQKLAPIGFGGFGNAWAKSAWLEDLPYLLFLHV